MADPAVPRSWISSYRSYDTACDLCQRPAGAEFLTITRSIESLEPQVEYDRRESARCCADCHEQNPDWPLAWAHVAGITLGRVPESMTALCHRCGGLVDRSEPHAVHSLLHIAQEGAAHLVVESGG